MKNEKKDWKEGGRGREKVMGHKLKRGKREKGSEKSEPEGRMTSWQKMTPGISTIK